MKIDAKTAAGIGTALNEATFLGAEHDPARNLVVTTFSVLTLPPDGGPEPKDRRRQIALTQVGRIAAALRDSRWDDEEAKPIPFAVSELLPVVRSFGGQPVYGWEFINADDPAYARWESRLSLDYHSSAGSLDNCIHLFQEGVAPDRHLELWIWFTGIQIRDALGNPIELPDFIAGGQRWWDALHSRDPRTGGHGIWVDRPQT